MTIVKELRYELLSVSAVFNVNFNMSLFCFTACEEDMMALFGFEEWCMNDFNDLKRGLQLLGEIQTALWWFWMFIALFYYVCCSDGVLSVYDPMHRVHYNIWHYNIYCSHGVSQCERRCSLERLRPEMNTSFFAIRSVSHTVERASLSKGYSFGRKRGKTHLAQKYLMCNLTV